jgi:hypothetical protein
MKIFGHIKKILPFAFILFVTTGADCSLKSLWGGTAPENLGVNDVGTIINNVINWLLGGVGAVAIVFIMVGGVQYITSIGNPEAAQKAKTTLTYAIGGLILVLAAYLIIKFIAGFLLSKNVFN